MTTRPVPDISGGTASWTASFGAARFLRTTVIPIEGDFVDWALDGGVLRLPEALAEREYRTEPHEYSTYTGEDHWEGDDDEEEEEGKHYDLSALVATIDTVLKEYEGGVFAMSDSVAPTDAMWCVANGEHLQCQSPTEVLTMLKASVLTTADWEQRKTAGLPLHIVLRKWYSLEQGMCFRCFAGNGRLLGVSQKRLSEYFPFLVSIAGKVLSACKTLFAGMQLTNGTPFSFDVYVTKGNTEKLKAKLLGLHSWEDGTLLFSEERLKELLDAPEQEFATEVRVIQDREGIRDCGVGHSMKQGVPEDLKDMSLLVEAAKSADVHNTGGEVEATVDEMIKMMQAEEAGAAQEG